jgi:hypothetical protein
MRVPLSIPHPESIRNVVTEPFWHDLGFTLRILVYMTTVFSITGLLLWAALWDQRYRCRTCLTRLRMPVATGFCTQVLLSRLRIEYICPFGHGTLKVQELQITGHTGPDWQPHKDMWKELAKK